MKKIFIIVVILILIGAIILFLIFGNLGEKINKEQAKEITVVSQEEDIEKLTTEEYQQVLSKHDLEIKAKNFIEQYGSFSSDAHFANLYDLQNKMTQTFWLKTEQAIKEAKKETATEFYGLTTKVLNSKEIFSSEKKIIYLFSTQKEETRGLVKTVFYQEVTLEMIQENSDWKINLIEWLEEK